MSRAGPGVSVLTYHSIAEGPGPTRIPPAVFHAQLQALADAQCTVLGLAEVAARLRGGLALPERAVALTFDDGYPDFLTVAVPALDGRGWPSTLFVPAARIGGRDDWPGMSAIHARPLLDWTGVADVAARGVEIGSHGMTHDDLTRLPAAAAAEEIAGSRRRLEERLGRPVTAFAYPFGWSTPAVRAMAACWYRVAVGTAMRRARPGDDLHDLPRIDMTYFRDPDRLRHLVERGASAYFVLRQVLRRAGQAVRSGFGPPR